jgi:methylated-DNA-protein-cysteine methyltransferase-like protein
MPVRSELYRSIYTVVRRIPRGRVATYGQVAELAGIPRHARQVGYALHALEWGSSVPWHRVINARGEISMRKAPGADSVQRQLLRRRTSEPGDGPLAPQEAEATVPGRLASSERRSRGVAKRNRGAGGGLRPQM